VCFCQKAEGRLGSFGVAKTAALLISECAKKLDIRCLSDVGCLDFLGRGDVDQRVKAQRPQRMPFRWDKSGLEVLLKAPSRGRIGLRMTDLEDEVEVEPWF
jgi:hypothetical protein